MCLQNLNSLLKIRGVEENLFLHWGDMKKTRHLETGLSGQGYDIYSHPICVFHSHATCGINLDTDFLLYWFLKKTKSGFILYKPWSSVSFRYLYYRQKGI